MRSTDDQPKRGASLDRNWLHQSKHRWSSKWSTKIDSLTKQHFLPNTWTQQKQLYFRLFLKGTRIIYIFLFKSSVYYIYLHIHIPSQIALEKSLFLKTYFFVYRKNHILQTWNVSGVKHFSHLNLVEAWFIFYWFFYIVYFIIWSYFLIFYFSFYIIFYYIFFLFYI